MAIVFLFSGQGSQYYQMGKELYQSNHVFRETMKRLDETAKQLIGESIIQQVYNPDKKISDIFNCTRYTHPAIFMLEYSLAQVMMENQINPDIVLGTSLGEFSAAAVSGVLSVEDVLEAVIKQAQCFEATCELGRMLAIIDDITYIEKLPLITKYSEMVGINFDKHFVVAGATNYLEFLENHLKKNNVTCQFLPVTHAFHSKYIEPAADFYTSYLRKKQLRNPRIPFISARYGRKINELPQDYFWQVSRKPILFREALQAVEELSTTNTYIDLGPSGTLANFVKYNLMGKRELQTCSIISPFGNSLARLQTVFEQFDNDIQYSCFD